MAMHEFASRFAGCSDNFSACLLYSVRVVHIFNKPYFRLSLTITLGCIRFFKTQMSYIAKNYNSN